jgi:DNA primase
VQRLALANPLLQLRGATAALERQRSLKRCRHLLNAWSAQRLETLERCIARLLDEGRNAAAEPAAAALPQPAALDMETRIDAMFADLNSDALRFQELYYNERQHIAFLDEQRRAGFDELMLQRPASAPAMITAPSTAAAPSSG